MHSNEIRQIFLEFFRTKAHTIVPSSPVVPVDDPTLLFTNAGMNQFKDILIGKVSPPYNPPRAASVQKCIRVSGKHNDLEEVGHDEYHHTFFEMLGNWSFGEYFKREAIIWAWEFLTEHCKIPSSKLWVAVHNSDDESASIWEKEVGIPPNRIIRCGDKDNFWEMAETGPCGPTTELHYDWGEHLDPQGLPNSSKRFVEVWNIVFMQYFRDEAGILHPLPAKNVDTGLGFERLVAIMQNTRDNYNTDIFAPIIDRISEASGYEYGSDARTDVAFRVLADHSRSLSFAIADGAMPGNTGRGYVLRRILRRAARFSRILGVHNPMLWRLVSPLVDKMGDTYPELRSRADIISQVIRSEEERFGKTLDFGIELFEKIAEKMEKMGQKEIPGEDVFRLYDTYGFPVDLTKLMASERGLSIDEAGFRDLMEGQRKRARSAAAFDIVHEKKGDFKIITIGDDSYSLCYETEVAEAEVRLMRHTGETLELVLSHTPFYAEAGGQVGDSGTITGEKFTLNVNDTQREGTHIVHICKNVEHIDRIIAAITDNPLVTAEVDHARRQAIRRNHTATHILHKALRMVLGEHVHQSGSFVGPERLRFDYTHFEAPTAAQLEEIERIANNVIRADYEVSASVISYTEAIRQGAMALFGEKYGETVRMISTGDFSKELCGGTHVSRSGEIGMLIILRDENIGSGMRRIEALTGEVAFNYIQDIRRQLTNIERQLGATGKTVFEKIEKMMDDLSELRKIQNKHSDQKAVKIAAELISSAVNVEGGKLVVQQVEVTDRNTLQAIMEAVEKEIPSGIILLGARIEDNKVAFVCRVTADFINKYGFKAVELVKKVAQIVSGSGGGKADFAQAGGKDPSKLGEAIEFAKKHIAHQMAK